MVQSSSSILFHIQGYQFSIQAFKSQMCFEQKSSRDPKVLCSSRIKSEKQKNCDLSLENVANGLPFVSRSAPSTQTRWEKAVGTAPATSDISTMYQFRKYCHPFEWLELSVRKARWSNPFRNNRQLFELLVAILWKKDVIRAKKKSSAVRASEAVSKK